MRASKGLNGLNMQSALATQATLIAIPIRYATALTTAHTRRVRHKVLCENEHASNRVALLHCVGALRDLLRESSGPVLLLNLCSSAFAIVAMVILRKLSRFRKAYD